MNVDILLAEDIKNFFKSNFNKIEFEDGLKLADAYLVVKKVSALAQEGEAHEDQIVSLFGHRPNNRTIGEFSNDLWIESEEKSGIFDSERHNSPVSNQHPNSVPERTKTASSNR